MQWVGVASQVQQRSGCASAKWCIRRSTHYRWQILL